MYHFLRLEVHKNLPRRNTRFGLWRRERFEQLERAALKSLPAGDFDHSEWKDAKLHPDCYVYVAVPRTSTAARSCGSG